MHDTIEKNGRMYRIAIEYDSDMGAPWEEYDGHGIVSKWTTRDKRAGECLLKIGQSYGMSGNRRFYDYAGTIKKAHAESWGLSDTNRATLAARLKRKPTAREIISEAARLDFEYLKSWCDDKWNWCGVIVTDVTDDESAPMDYYHAVWGFSSEDDEGQEECAHELVRQIEYERAVNNRFTDAMACGV